MKERGVKSQFIEKECYGYHSVRRPISVGTFPINSTGPTEIIPYDIRKWESDDHTMSWGKLYYEFPLSETEIEEYELSPCWKNPDLYRVIAEVLKAVGEMETNYELYDNDRLTYWDTIQERYEVKEDVTWNMLLERFNYTR